MASCVGLLTGCSLYQKKKQQLNVVSQHDNVSITLKEADVTRGPDQLVLHFDIDNKSNEVVQINDPLPSSAGITTVSLSGQDTKYHLSGVSGPGVIQPEKDLPAFETYFDINTYGFKNLTCTIPVMIGDQEVDFKLPIGNLNFN